MNTFVIFHLVNEYTIIISEAPKIAVARPAASKSKGKGSKHSDDDDDDDDGVCQ